MQELRVMWCGLGLVGFTRFLLEQTNPGTSSCPLVTSPPICDSWATSPSNLCRFQRSIKHNNPTKQVSTGHWLSRILRTSQRCWRRTRFSLLSVQWYHIELTGAMSCSPFFCWSQEKRFGCIGYGRAKSCMKNHATEKTCSMEKRLPGNLGAIISNFRGVFGQGILKIQGIPVQRAHCIELVQSHYQSEQQVWGPTGPVVVMSWAERMFQGFKRNFCQKVA